MGITARELLEDALKLTDQERAQLAAWLIESLDDEADDAAAEGWQAEIERRVQELDQGTVEPIPWSKARRLIVEGETPDGSSGCLC